MAVVFPAPLGPRKPKMAPSVDGEVNVVDRDELLAEDLRQVLHLDNLLAHRRPMNRRRTSVLRCINGGRKEFGPRLFLCLDGFFDYAYEMDDDRIPWRSSGGGALNPIPIAEYANHARRKYWT